MGTKNSLEKFQVENNELNSTKTEPGTRNGVLVNGVEILNYKSLDGLNYGKLESIVVDNPGFGYDVINPPNLVITDGVGSGATGNVNVEDLLIKSIYNMVDLIISMIL